MIPYIGRIVTRSSDLRYIVGAERIGWEQVQAIDGVNRELASIKDRFTTGNRCPILSVALLPRLVDSEYVRIEAEGQRIVDADEEQLLRERRWTAGGAVSEQGTGLGIEYLCVEDCRLKCDDLVDLCGAGHARIGLRVTLSRIKRLAGQRRLASVPHDGERRASGLSRRTPGEKWKIGRGERPSIDGHHWRRPGQIGASVGIVDSADLEVSLRWQRQEYPNQALGQQQVIGLEFVVEGADRIARTGGAVDDAEDRIGAPACVKAFLNRCRAHTPSAARFMAGYAGTAISAEALKERIVFGYSGCSEIICLNYAGGIEALESSPENGRKDAGRRRYSARRVAYLHCFLLHCEGPGRN